MADGLVEGGAGRNRQLERIAALVDWAAFERLLGDIYAAPVGRPSYGPLILFRCLLLAQWYGLSDPALEEALSDRLSFRRFVGLALADPVPDHSTFSRFRTELVERRLSERLLAELNRQLDARGLMVKAGTLIDASLVAADARRPRKDEPLEGRSDRDASWNAMPEQPLFGYKMHLAVDQGSGLVRRAMLTPATSRTRRRFWPWSRATSGRYTPIAATTAGGTAGSWPSGASRTASWPAAIASARWTPPPRPQPGARRDPAPVERTFAILKRHYGYTRVRYRRLVRNALQLQLLALAMNLRRALVLVR